MTTPHARPMTPDELRANLRAAWSELNQAQANLDRVVPRDCPWVAGTLPARRPRMTIRLQPYHSLTITRPKVRARIARRVVAALAYTETHPAATTHNDPALHRLDVLISEVYTLWRRLP